MVGPGSVDEHLRAGRGEQDGKPFQEAGAEAVLPEDLEEERPVDGVEGTSQVQLQKGARGAELLQEARGLAHEDEVVVQVAPRDEVILASADEAAELRGEPEREDLGEELSKNVYQADGAIVKQA